MSGTRASNGFLWSSLAFSVFMAAHLFLFRFFNSQDEMAFGTEMYIASVMGLLLILSLVMTAFCNKALRDGRGVSEFLGLKPAGNSNLLLGLISVFMFIPASAILLFINSYAVDLFSGMQNPVISATDMLMKMGLLPALFFMALLPAICEELFFRGFILGVTSGYSKKAAVIFNGFLFALAYADLSRLLDAFVLGMILAYVTLKTKSIFPAMLMHFIGNGARVLLTYVMLNSDLAVVSIGQGGRWPSSLNDMIYYLAFIAFSILFFAGGLGLVCRMKDLINYKRVLYGLDPEPEFPNRTDGLPALLQLFFIIPGLACYILFSVNMMYDIPLPEFLSFLS